MVTALIVLASTEEHPSQVPFYGAGLLLVAFALVVSAVGLRSTRFPASRGLRNGVMALCAVLVAAAMATAVITA